MFIETFEKETQISLANKNNHLQIVNFIISNNANDLTKNLINIEKYSNSNISSFSEKINKYKELKKKYQTVISETMHSIYGNELLSDTCEETDEKPQRKHKTYSLKMKASSFNFDQNPKTANQYFYLAEEYQKYY